MRAIKSLNMIALAAAAVLAGAGEKAHAQTPRRAVDYVNPFIGTADHGHTYPGATVPFGMVQLSPDNGRSGWDWCSGYNYGDSVIAGFSHLHLSGTGIGDLCDISVMPSVGILPGVDKITSSFSHDREIAEPGYYAVLLKDFGLWTELTATPHAGMHRYIFPASGNSQIRFDLGFAVNWDKATEGYFRRINDTTFVGYRYSTGWAKDQRVYFAVVLSKPVKDMVLFSDSVRVKGNEAKGRDVKACLLFDTKPAERVLMKVGLSFADIDGAQKSLEEIPGWDFDAVRKIAVDAWQDELGKVEVSTADTRLKQTFYTALYHSFEAPVTFTDRNLRYKGIDGKPVKATGTRYTVHSIWDTFRANNPLFTLLQGDRVPDIINSYLDFYDQYGLLPVWDLEYNETNCMTGYHSVAVISDAILKGFKGFDVEKAYTAMKKSAMQDIRGSNLYRQYGYVPQDKLGSSVTITLEYAYDDWCIAQVAKYLNRPDDYTAFMKRAHSYIPLFDARRGFFRAKNADGSWVEPFDPYYSEHDPDKAMYTEGNAWQHSWFVPQDPQGLINLFGSKAAYIGKLDSLFIVPSVLKGDNTSPDISGMIGQYAQGNEPSHHIAYLYNYAGEPWKTAEKIRLVTDSLYNNTPHGLCGNEDCGQMSAWYVFSALGFYPVNPASGQYVLGSPLFDRVTLNLPGNKTFTVVAQNNSPINKYIESAVLNGKKYDKSYITHADIMKGGVLELVMGDKPGSKWGTAAADLPSSMSEATAH
ncbi:GH92 family glycosyl hydrolase [Dinghuibacter silviterrae]|uniref:Putative alpha-1,2-mannosidase n=1 Tax=Dinghuibacter silviterrae TaxID=1539049 RepID=A0A4R8DR05_9BACT|nr:GH92 family glycosyl hydrolase [Dinghuibacter silviterrae]TDX00592.1 putative alpha-1,2-mannosidase [Dinghuibacter silviterrae]